MIVLQVASLSLMRFAGALFASLGRAGVVALALAGCSENDATTELRFPEAPLSVVSSASGRLELEVRTSPEQPPVRGSSRVELTVNDQDGVLDGLVIHAVPWMPSMGHGAAVEPSSVPAGEGRYVLSDVELYMPGRWDLRLELAGSTSDSALVVLDVR